MISRSTLAELACEELQDRMVSGVLPAGRRLLASRRISFVHLCALADIKEIHEADAAT